MIAVLILCPSFSQFWLQFTKILVPTNIFFASSCQGCHHCMVKWKGGTWEIMCFIKCVHLQMITAHNSCSSSFLMVFDAQDLLKNQKMALLVVLRDFLGGIGTLPFNEFWYFLKMKVSFLLYWFFKQSKRVLFIPFFHLLLSFFK